MPAAHLQHTPLPFPLYTSSRWPSPASEAPSPPSCLHPVQGFPREQEPCGFPPQPFPREWFPVQLPLAIVAQARSVQTRPRSPPKHRRHPLPLTPPPSAGGSTAVRAPCILALLPPSPAQGQPTPEHQTRDHRRNTCSATRPFVCVCMLPASIPTPQTHFHSLSCPWIVSTAYPSILGLLRLPDPTSPPRTSWC